MLLRDLVPFVQFGNLKNTDEEALLLLNSKALASNLTKSNTPPWMFFTFFKLYIWLQIAQCISYVRQGHEARQSNRCPKSTIETLEKL